MAQNVHCYSWREDRGCSEEILYQSKSKPSRTNSKCGSSMADAGAWMSPSLQRPCCGTLLSVPALAAALHSRPLRASRSQSHLRPHVETSLPHNWPLWFSLTAEEDSTTPFFCILHDSKARTKLPNLPTHLGWSLGPFLDHICLNLIVVTF